VYKRQGMILPWVAGQAAQAAGLRWVFVIVAVSFGAIFVLGRLMARPSTDAAAVR